MNLERVISECREVIYEEPYERALRSINSDVILADEFMEGVLWLVQRTPEAGKPITEGSAVHYFCSTDTPGLPNVTLFYTFTERKVWFLDLIVHQD